MEEMWYIYGKKCKKVGETMEKPQLIYQKNADKTNNRIVLPKNFVDKWGNAYFMEVYEDKIILVPIKEK